MSPRRIGIYGLMAVAAVAVALLAWNWSGLRAKAQLGAAYGARVTCSCRYVEGRTMESCRDDKAPGMWAVALRDRPESRSVKASVPLLASRTASYRKGWGCLLEP